jgi:hypothetical protein
MSTSQPDILHIEAFDDNLRGRRILQFLGGKAQPQATPIYERAEADSADAFQRKVLITAASASSQEYLRTRWDVHYNLADPKEWILIVTYIVNAPKPLCVVCEGVDLPDLVMKKIATVAGVTILCQRQLTGGPGGPGSKNIGLYDVIFLPVVDDIGGTEANTILHLFNTLSPVGASSEDRREWLKELRVARAGLVWSRHSGVSWYDPNETVKTIGGNRTHNVGVIAGYLRTLADVLSMNS